MTRLDAATKLEQVALVARTDGIRQELHDRLRLLEISKVRPDQFGYTFRALAGFPLVAPPLAETQIFRDSTCSELRFSG